MIICMCRNDDVLVRSQIERINRLVDEGFSGKFCGYKATYDYYLGEGMVPIGVSMLECDYIGEKFDFIVVDLHLSDAFPSREFLARVLASTADSSLAERNDIRDKISKIGDHHYNYKIPDEVDFRFVPRLEKFGDEMAYKLEKIVLKTKYLILKKEIEKLKKIIFGGE